MQQDNEIVLVNSFELAKSIMKIYRLLELTEQYQVRETMLTDAVTFESVVQFIMSCSMREISFPYE